MISQCSGHATAAGQSSSQQRCCRALELVSEMRVRGVSLNVHTYSALLNVCSKCNQPELAVEVRDQMLAVRCVEGLWRGLGLCFVWRARARRASTSACHPLHKAAPTNAPITHARPPPCNPYALQEGIPPNMVTYNTLCDLYAKAGRWRDALAVLDTLRSQVGGWHGWANSWLAMRMFWGAAEWGGGQQRAA